MNSVKDFGVSDIYDEDGEMISKQDFFFLECSHGYSFAVRGSGTEPKIKFYVFAQKSLSEGINYLKLNQSLARHESIHGIN